MSASTQGQTLPNQTPGNGHQRGTPGRKPGQKAAVKPTPPLAAGQQPTAGLTGGASQTNVAERRIGPMPIPAGLTGFPVASINWLYARQQECEIELRLIRSMIAQFGPRRATTIAGAPRKAKAKAKKRRAVKQAA
jgi:hypothetical protein